MKIVECIPNISEGRNVNVIHSVATACERAGASLLHTDTNYSAHRTVVTFIGTPEEVSEGAYQLILEAANQIDMTKHRGTHPRLGATDVCPFVPLSGMEMDECVALSRQVGRRVAKELSIPIFFYEESAYIPNHRRLPDVRKGEFELLGPRIDQADVSPSHPRISAGATIMGARKILIAFNINLSSNASLDDAKHIAAALRQPRRWSPDGTGLPACRAIGWHIPEFGCAQVSVNIIDYTITSLWRVFERTSKLAAQYGATVTGSELIGLIPKSALLRVVQEADPKYQGEERSRLSRGAQLLQLSSLSPFHLEDRVLEYSMKRFRNA